ncbi:MAG TPA: AtpZ/AtpI family protein [Myxococcota bacterium]
MTEGRDEQGRSARREGAAYQGALEAVFALLIGAGAGYWGDSSFGTSPWLLLLGTALGFTTFVVRLLRMRRQE